MIRKGIQTAVLLLTLLCIQLPALAITVNGSLTSAAWVRENRLETAKQNNLLLYEYISLNALDVGSPELAAHLSGRVGWDRYASLGENYTERLYEGYLDWKLSNKSSLRLGRQFLSNDLGFWQMDGARLGTLRSGFISPTFYAGTSVLPWTIKGDSEPILGIELDTKRFLGMRGKFGFFTIFDNEKEGWNVSGIRGVDKAILGIHFDTYEGVIDLLEYPHKRPNISCSGNIDLLGKGFINGYAAADIPIISKIQLYTEYRHETPLFPADSIFSVFAVEPSRELIASVNYDAASFLGLQGRYARQFFDLGPVNQYGAGLTIERQHETLMALRLERLDDIDTHYWRLYSHIGKRLWRKLDISLNNYYNNYKLTTAPQTENAYSFQLNVRYQLNGRMQALLRLEDNVNPEYKYNVRLLGYLRMGFGFTK